MAGMDRAGFNRYYYDPESIISTLVIVLFFSDFTLGTLLYIVEGNNMKKNRSLLRAYYFYSIGLCALTVVLTGVLIGLAARGWFTYNMSMYNLTIRILDYTSYFVNIALQVYFVLLLRSEIMNGNEIILTDKGEAEYMIQYKDEEAGGKETDYLKWEKESLNQKIWQM